MQNRNKHLQETFGTLMAQTQRQWRRAIDRELQPLGLTEASWLALVHLSRASEPMRQKDLAASLSLDGSSVVRLVDNLQAAGLVDRLEHMDRRAYTIVLTARGESTVKQVQLVAHKMRERILGPVPEQELEIACRVMGQLLEILDRIQEQQTGAKVGG